MFTWITISLLNLTLPPDDRGEGYGWAWFMLGPIYLIAFIVSLIYWVASDSKKNKY